MKLLIDADFIVYKSCAAAETEIDFGDDVIIVTSKFTEAYNKVTRELNKIHDAIWDSGEMILFLVIQQTLERRSKQTTRDTVIERNLVVINV